MRLPRFRWLPILLGLPVLSFAQPLWWSTRGLLTGQGADDFAAANVGQLKAFASAATVEMNLRFSGGAGAAVNAVVAPWFQPATGTRDDFAAVNVGQLKTIAEPFYARLQALGYSGVPLTGGNTRPWSSSVSDDDDYALINLGQLKFVFSFVIAAPGDTDADGLLDSWELALFGSLAAQSGAGNTEAPSGDALSNRAESLVGSSPTVFASGDANAVAALALTVYSP